MKKTIAMLLVLLMISSLSFAEDSMFSVDGEWYMTFLFTQEGYVAEKDNDGVFHIKTEDAIVTIHPDGTIDGLDGIKTVTYCKLSDDATILYAFHDNKPGFMLFLYREKSYRLYSLYYTKEALFHNGNMIVYGDSKRIEYHLYDDKLYLIDDDEYSGGIVQPCGKDAFIYNLDSKQADKNMDDDKWGGQFMFFVRTSIVK